MAATAAGCVPCMLLQPGSGLYIQTGLLVVKKLACAYHTVLVTDCRLSQPQQANQPMG